MNSDLGGLVGLGVLLVAVLGVDRWRAVRAKRRRRPEPMPWPAIPAGGSTHGQLLLRLVDGRRSVELDLGPVPIPEDGPPNCQAVAQALRAQAERLDTWRVFREMTEGLEGGR